jgi:hypothetical protein
MNVPMIIIALCSVIVAAMFVLMLGFLDRLNETVRDVVHVLLNISRRLPEEIIPDGTHQTRNTK